MKSKCCKCSSKVFEKTKKSSTGINKCIGIKIRELDLNFVFIGNFS